MTPSNRQLLTELRQKHFQLRSFRMSLNQRLRERLESYDWAIVAGAGHDGLPLFVLRLPHRVSLRDPFLVGLAEHTEQICGPVDFALFSGETQEPLKVLSQTLLDHRWRSNPS